VIKQPSIYSAFGTPVKILGLALPTGRNAPALLSVRFNYADGTSRDGDVLCCDLKADGGVGEIETALIAACGKNLYGDHATNAVNEIERVVLDALRRHVESGGAFDAAGREWGQVYLDNAFADLRGWKRSTFAGYLSSLSVKGFYRTQGDDAFGDVLLSREPAEVA
jgi:hypothetical protein